MCSIVFVGAACFDNTETGNDRIYAVYKIYAAHAEEIFKLI